VLGQSKTHPVKALLCHPSQEGIKMEGSKRVLCLEPKASLRDSDAAYGLMKNDKLKMKTHPVKALLCHPSQEGIKRMGSKRVLCLAAMRGLA
jgi:hypothetical protein